jgi:hypothetical protein
MRTSSSANESAGRIGDYLGNSYLEFYNSTLGNFRLVNKQGSANFGGIIFETGSTPTDRWRITNLGILRSNGAQTIQTSTGDLTIATGGGNGNINLNAQGTGTTIINKTTDSATFSLLRFNTARAWEFRTINAGSETHLSLVDLTGGKRLNFVNDIAGESIFISPTLRRLGSSSFLSFGTESIERWRISETGILQSNGAQTIQTSTGNLTLATAGGNGNILLSPNGSGNVEIGYTALQGLYKLDVNGSGRFSGNINGAIFRSNNGSITLSSGTYGLIINIPDARSNYIINVVGTTALNQLASSFILSAIISKMPGSQTSEITIIKPASSVDIRVVNNTEIEVRQNSGVSQTLSWSILRLL